MNAAHISKTVAIALVSGWIYRSHNDGPSAYKAATFTTDGIAWQFGRDAADPGRQFLEAVDLGDSAAVAEAAERLARLYLNEPEEGNDPEDEEENES